MKGIFFWQQWTYFGLCRLGLWKSYYAQMGGPKHSFPFSFSPPYSHVAGSLIFPRFFFFIFLSNTTHSWLPHFLGFPIFLFIFSPQSSISGHTPLISLLPPFFFCYFIFLLLLPFFSSNLFPFSSSTKPHFQRRTTRENFLIPSSPIFLSFLHHCRPATLPISHFLTSSILFFFLFSFFLSPFNSTGDQSSSASNSGNP